MAERDTPSTRERQLARELRVLRGTVGLQGKDVADRLGWSASKVSRIETSRIGISAQDLNRLLELYQVQGDQAEKLRNLASSARSKGWWDAYGDALDPGYATLIRQESESQALQCYCALVPHAMLQTPEYARHVIHAVQQKPPLTEVDRRIQVCQRRGDLLDGTRRRQPLRFWAVVDEAVLSRQVRNPEGDAGTAVLCGQFERLAEVATWPNVTIQVLPFEAGLPPVTAGSFSILESRATGACDLVYLENKTRSYFIDSEAEVHAYTQDFALLTAMALTPDDSLDVIKREVARLRTSEGRRESDVGLEP
jgi:transcriptional regulator with XRE-family HTH domain